MEIREICKKYAVKSKRFKEKEKQIAESIKILQNQIEALEKQSDKHAEKYPHWTDHLVKPIAEELVKLLPGRYYKILGPFGLNCEVSIHFYKNKFKKMSHREQMRQKFTAKGNCKSIGFRPGDLEKGELHLIGKNNTGKYPKGTFGQANGGNFESLDMPETIEELERFVK